MTPDELEERTKVFALDVIAMVESLPRSTAGRHVADQLLRSASSTAANYRAARRARSPKEFLSKLCIVVEEADEAEFWLKMVGRSKLMDRERIVTLYREAGELMRIFAAQRRTASQPKKGTP